MADDDDGDIYLNNNFPWLHVYITLFNQFWIFASCRFEKLFHKTLLCSFGNLLFSVPYNTNNNPPGTVSLFFKTDFFMALLLKSFLVWWVIILKQVDADITVGMLYPVQYVW